MTVAELILTLQDLPPVHEVIVYLSGKFLEEFPATDCAAAQFEVLDSEHCGWKGVVELNLTEVVMA